MNPRIVFFGTPEFSVPALRCLVHAGYNVVGVVTQPDEPVGRHHILTPSPVKIVATELSLPVFQPRKLSQPETLEKIRSWKPDVGVVVAYGKILPAAVLGIPSRGMMNVHPSLLPDLRGPSPIQYAILEGRQKTGVTIMLMDEGMDTGPLLFQSEILLTLSETYPSLSEKLSRKAASDLLYTLPRYLSGEIQPKAQSLQGVTMTKLLEKEDGRIHWNRTAFEIACRIRGFTPWPGAFCEFSGVRVKILEAHVGKNGPIVIPCGKNTFLSLTKLQPAGKSALSAEEFLRGYAHLLPTGNRIHPLSHF